jgi:RNA polymerase sigma-70 factor (ECF subfamily)
MFLSKRLSLSSDSDLIERFRVKGDQKALGELFTRYSALVYGVCLKYLKDRENAKDAVMQIFEKLNTTLKAHDIDQFKSWLYVTSRNHCLMHIRSAKKFQKQESTDFFMETELVLHLDNDDTGNEQDLDKLEKCIEQLNSDQKKCVQLFYLKEMCYKEIVSHTGLDLNKVKSHIQNGKRNIKICMEQSG